MKKYTLRERTKIERWRFLRVGDFIVIMQVGLDSKLTFMDISPISEILFRDDGMTIKLKNGYSFELSLTQMNSRICAHITVGNSPYRFVYCDEKLFEAYYNEIKK